MITSIFSKSKPINFLIVFLITLVAFVLAKAKLSSDVISIAFILEQAFVFSVCYGSILVLNFIVGKNNLTQKNNYEILLFSLFLAMIPQTMLSTNIIVSNFFVLLALRRVISLRSQIQVKKKLFDAAFWIAIASLFYFWAILFVILIFVALMFYLDNKIRHWVIPFSGLLGVALITMCFSIIKYDDFFKAFNFSFEVGYNFNNYNTIRFIVAITVLLSFGLWASIFYIGGLKDKMKMFRPSFKIILFATLIALTIIVLSPIKNGSEFLFLFAPLAIIMTNYLEAIKEKWFKELFLFVLVLTPIVLLLL